MVPHLLKAQNGQAIVQVILFLLLNLIQKEILRAILQIRKETLIALVHLMELIIMVFLWLHFIVIIL